MRAGELKKRIDLQKKTRVSDGMGAATESWSTIVSSLWAAIWPVSAVEQVRAGQDQMTITHRVRIRYRANVTPDMRIKYGSRYFNIVSIINPNMDNRMIEFLAKEEGL